MAQEWSYKFMGETVGPLSPSELRDHAIDGRVQPDSLVTRDGTDDWVSADRIKGLFDSDAGLLLKTEDIEKGCRLLLPLHQQTRSRSSERHWS